VRLAAGAVLVVALVVGAVGVIFWCLFVVVT
jgi:hypothetical protein